jgi:hypothetical protein
MTGPAGLAEPDRPRRWNDDAAMLEFDLAAGSTRPATDPAEKARRLVERARERHDAREFQAAIGLLERALDLDSAYLPAWRWKAYCLVELGNLDGAIAELTRARGAVRGPDAVSKVDEMLDACRRHLTDRPIEEARRELREDRPRQAVVILEKLAGTLAGDEAFDARLTYARERAQAAESRAPTAGTTLTLVALQGVLGWLCREETTNGDRALEAEDYRAAATWYARARKRDDRHCRAALGEARSVNALAFAVLSDLPQKTRDVRKAVTRVAQMLRRADSLTQVAAADRTLAEEAASVRKSVADQTAANDAFARRLDKIMAVNECVADYNAVVQQFNEGDSNWLTYSNLRTSFPPVEARAHRLYKKYGPDDPDVGKALVGLDAAVRRLRKDLR